MASKIVKIGLAVLGIIFGGFEMVSGGKDLIDAIKETPEEETTEEKAEELE